MAISVANFTERFKETFGDEIWDDFIEYGRSNQDTKSLNSIHDVIKQLNAYKKKIANRNLYTKGKNRRFVRFALISIERAFRSHSRSTIFNEKEELNNGHFNRSWEVEHIFPSKGPKCFDNIINVPKKTDSSPKEGTNRNEQIEKITRNSICNLTLISRELNGAEGYKNEDFQTKKDVMNSPKKEKDVMNPAKKEYYEEKDFYINRIFQDDQATDSSEYLDLLLRRKKELNQDFKKIFEMDGDDNPFLFFKEVLGFSENEIQSTFPRTP